MPAQAAPSDIGELALFASGPVVLFKWRNAEGWPVEWVSPNVRDVFGYSAEQLMAGRPPYGSLVHEDDIERVVAEVVAAVDSGCESFEHKPYRIRRADGAVRWLYDVTQVLRSGGEVTHFVGYVIDITERHEAVQRQHALEKHP